MPTLKQGFVPPNPEEVIQGASKVELYQCSDILCHEYVRFPRISDVLTLLKTRRGRAGGWADCFTLLCRALGSRVRYVWCSEDLCWSEVFSEHQSRWIHADPCEEAWDQPRIYTEGIHRGRSSL